MEAMARVLLNNAYGAKRMLRFPRLSLQKLTSARAGGTRIALIVDPTSRDRPATLMALFPWPRAPRLSRHKPLRQFSWNRGNATLSIA